MKTFAEAQQAINDFTVSLDTTKSYTLERIEKLLHELGNPQDEFKTVHVAGTSGKTSTCYFIAAMLKAGGFKTGLSVSPHIEEINERVQIGLEPLPEKIFCEELEAFLKILNTLSVKPTYFELFVAFAYWYFAKIGVDYAVVEVGLGGLLDGTNVIKRPDKVCVITDIGLDHTHILGKTITEVARQKAGIIQDHNSVFMHEQDSAVKEEIIKRAGKEHATLHYIVQPPDNELPAELPDFQKRNWNLARETCEFIFAKEGAKQLTEKEWLKTANTIIPGRLETFSHKGKTIVMDGAHNSQKMETLLESLRSKFPGDSSAVLLAVSDGKDVHLDMMVKELEKFTDFVIVTTFDTNQDTPKKSIDPAKIQKYFKRTEAITEPDLNQALSMLISRPEKILLLTGSLYLISEARKLLKNLK